jgi:heme exporter protein D
MTVHWSSLAEFAEMGGYALYVWGSFVMCAAAMAWEAVMLAARRQRALDELREDQRVHQAGVSARDTLRRP